MPVLRDIPNEDAKHIREGIRNKQFNEPLTESLKEAISSFLVGGSIRLCRGQWKEHITMLIHFSHLTDPQTTMKREIEEHIDDLKYQFEENSEDFKNKLYKLWVTDFAPVTKKISGSVDHEFEKVFKNAKKLIEKLEIIEDNSQSEERLSFDRELREGEPLWGIVVGGNTLSRGLTLEGLTSSYFVRDSKAYDTLLQMGRWFGFRAGYADLTRIYVTGGLFRNFYELATIEQEIRDEIKVMANNGEKPKHVALRIRKLPGMIITANNKMRSAIASKCTYSGQKIQSHQLIVSDQELIAFNSKQVEILLKKSKEHGNKENVKFSDLEQCHLFKDLNSELILQFLDNYQVSDGNAKYDKRAIQSYIADLTSKGELQSWSVALMSLKNGESINVAGLDTIPLVRSVKHELGLDTGHIEATLRAVSTPGEEIIDLSDRVSGLANTTDDVLAPKNGDKLSDTEARNKLRPRDRGLIMIYPLESNLNMSEEEYSKTRNASATSYPLRAAGQLFAISIVFPYSNSGSGSYNYMKNKSV